MAFTNPILAGEELNRTGIKSANYLPGVSGWRIASDGAAEFDNIGIRGNLWVPSITLGGTDLAALVNSKAKGIVAWNRGYPTTATTSEAQIFTTEGSVVAGRMYEAALFNVTPDIGNTKAVEFHLHYLLNSSLNPNHANASTFGISLRLSQFELGSIRALYPAVNSGQLKIAATIVSLDGQNVRVWCPGDGGVIMLNDLGLSVAATGTVGTGLPTRVLKEWTITANDSKSYLGTTGAARTDQYWNSLVQGDWANGKGNQRAWFTFSNADDAAYLDDLIGVPLSDIVTAELRLSPYQYGSLTNDGWLAIGFHNTKNALPNTEPGGGIPNVHRPYVIGTGPMWIGLLGGSVPTNFLDSMRDGYLNGFMIGNTFSGVGYQIVCEGVPNWANPPQLHMKYWKNV